MKDKQKSSYKEHQSYAGFEVLSITGKLKEEIQLRNLSYRELSRRMGTSHSHLCRVLKTGYEDKVKLSTLVRIAKCLGLKLTLTLSLGH